MWKCQTFTPNRQPFESKSRRRRRIKARTALAFTTILSSFFRVIFLHEMVVWCLKINNKINHNKPSYSLLGLECGLGLSDHFPKYDSVYKYSWFHTYRSLRRKWIKIVLFFHFRFRFFLPFSEIFPLHCHGPRFLQYVNGPLNDLHTQTAPKRQ